MLRLNDIIEATGGEVISGNVRTFTGVSTDSRTIQEGELFVALRGERFDGHDFLKDALKRGSGAIINILPAGPLKNKTVIHVKDTLKALQDIARHMRLKRDIPVIGITGANGKTTTKELIASVLSMRYRVLKNAGNLNNHIGLPLTLTKIEEDDEVVVLEMGASAPGDIKELCEIALPQYGVLTNIGPVHLEGFGDMETVRRTKLELLGYVTTAFLNADDAFLMEGVYASGFEGKVMRYGIEKDAEVFATDVQLLENGSVFFLHIGREKTIGVQPKISGRFNVYNLLAATAVGQIFNIDFIDIKKALDSFTGIPMRLELKEVNGLQVISDVYNANPASMEEAIKELVRRKKGRIIAVLGDMLELGFYAEEAHRKLGRWMSELPIDIFIAVGPLMSLAASEFTGNVYTRKSAAEAGGLLKDISKKGDTVLIKGSRAIGMERVLGT